MSLIELKEYRINEVCESIIDCVNKTAKHIDYETPFKMIRTTNVKSGWIKLEEVRYVTEEVFKKWTRRVTPQIGDIILTREAPLGEVGLVRTDDKIFLGQRTILYRANKEVADNRFLYYQFLSDLVQGQFFSFGSGSTVEHIRIEDCETFKVFLPELKTQQRIASILSAYDDLIEVNNQRIKLLEETARELYKEWFVRMRFPEYKKAKFKKGIPADWKHIPIGKVIDYNIGGGWGNDNADTTFSKPGYVIRGTDIPSVRGGVANTEVYRFHKPSNMESRQLVEGDIVFETAGGSEGQLLGRTCFITNEILEAYGDKVMCASFCKLVRTTSIPSLYLYYFINYLYDTGMIETFQTQSTGISNYQFEPFLKFQEILLPDKDLMEAFHNKVLIMQKQIVTLGTQNTHLRQIRDRLLPRLISGKLKLKT